jgi:cytochrome bd-type quinol oxidase subunit 1
VSQIVTFSKAQSRLVRLLSRRRTYAFFFGLYLVSSVTSLDQSTTIRRLASLAALAAIVAGLLVVAVGWRRRTLRDLERQQWIILGLLVVVAATVAANFHFPAAVFTFLLLLNWFV